MLVVGRRRARRARRDRHPAISGAGPTLASGKSTKPRPDGPTNSRKPQINKLKETLRHALSHAAPLRLWIGGDSLSGELGYTLGPILTKLGIVKTRVDYKISSGLAGNGVRDWPQRFSEEQQQYQPEAAIFMVGANDASIVGSALDAIGKPAWEAEYRASVGEMMDLLIGGPAQRTVFWIGPPTLGTRYDHGAKELGRVMREEAAKRPTIVYIDAYSLFSENGEYSAYLTDSDGDRVRMRISDGVHFTPAGADLLTEHVYKLLNSRWNLAGQADPSSPIDYSISEGGSVGRRSAGSSNGNETDRNNGSQFVDDDHAGNRGAHDDRAGNDHADEHRPHTTSPLPRWPRPSAAR